MEVFMEFLESGQIEKVTVDADQADALLHLLDAVVIKLEGGTEEDLKILDVKPPKPPAPAEPAVTSKEKDEIKENKTVVEKKLEDRLI